MRIATTLTVTLGMMLVPSIGSSGIGTMEPQANHVDRALFLGAGGRAVDLRAVDAVVEDEVMRTQRGTAAGRD